MKAVNKRKKEYKVQRPKYESEVEHTSYDPTGVLKPLDEKTFAQTINASENVYHRIWVRPRFIVYEIYQKRPIEILGFLIVWVPYTGDTQWHRIENRPYQSMWRDMEIITSELEKADNKTIAR